MKLENFTIQHSLTKKGLGKQAPTPADHAMSAQPPSAALPSQISPQDEAFLEEMGVDPLQVAAELDGSQAFADPPYEEAFAALTTLTTADFHPQTLPKSQPSARSTKPVSISQSKHSFWKTGIIGETVAEIKKPMTWVKATIEKFGEIAKEALPEIQAAKSAASSKAIEAFSGMKNLEALGIKGAEDLAAWTGQSTKFITSSRAALKYGLFATSSKALSLAGKAFVGLEVGLGVRAVINVSPADRMRVAFEQGGKIVFGGLGGGLGTIVAGGEEGVSLGLATPAAIATVAIGGSIGATVGKRIGDALYEVSESIYKNTEEEIEKFQKNTLALR